MVRNNRGNSLHSCVAITNKGFLSCSIRHSGQFNASTIYGSQNDLYIWQAILKLCPLKKQKAALSKILTPTKMAKNVDNLY